MFYIFGATLLVGMTSATLSRISARLQDHRRVTALQDQMAQEMEEHLARRGAL